ncbi:MAG: CHAT domain-containing tetratricopeptide repeat protein [Ferruginibacter sp.]
MKPAIFFMLASMVTSILPGQCPDRGFLWHRIIFLRDTLKNAPEEQLVELLGYEKKIDQCSYKKDSTHALLLQRIGWLYTTKHDYLNAIQYTQESIALVKQQPNNPRINPAMAIKSYYNLSLMYDILKLEAKKILAVDSSISQANYLNTWNSSVLGAITLKIEWLFSIGDYFSCITYATMGECIAFKISTTTMEAEQLICDYNYFNWKINALLFLNKTAEASRIVTDKIRFAENNRKIDFLAAYYGLYASVLRKKEKSQEAIGYFKKSFQYNQKIDYKPGCAEALNNIGYIYSNALHQNRMAIYYHFEALKFAEGNESLNILANIANLYAQAGNYDSAFSFFQKAFNQLGPGFTESDLLKSDNPELTGKITEYITGMMLYKAAAWLSKYKTTGHQQALKEAIDIYQLTDRYFEKLKVSQSEIQSKLFWKTNNRLLYEQAIEACYESRNTDKALHFFEKSRSVLLNDQIMEQRRMEDSDLAKQAQLNKNKQEIEKELQYIPSSSGESLPLLRQLIANKQEQEILVKNSNSRHPFNGRDYLDTTAISLELVRKKILNANRSLLEIFTGDSAIYILSITASNSNFVRLNKHLYDTLTTAFISYVANPQKLNRYLPGFVKISHQLYELIFQHIQLPAGGSLLISPDGKSFPFEALITNGNDRQPDYLLNHYATSYTYSARFLVNEYKVNSKHNNNLLGMAPVKFKNSFGLAELPGSDLSLQKIKSDFPDATNFVFEKATKENFLQHFPDYAIVQLYTHATDSSNNNDPVIYFSDSALNLSYLVNDRKPLTQLVVLSACETANGRLYEGEGIFSFNRGFAALGIPAAVSNLWSVDNESTYRITELFYQYLSQGLPTDVALQKAKIEFINNSSSREKTLPYFWAATILTGKVDTIKVNPGAPWKKLAVVAALFLCIGYLTKKSISNKRKKSHPLDQHENR